MTTSIRIQSLRRIVEITAALLFLSIPFITLKGDSLLRFDIPSLRFFFFGKAIPIEYFFMVLTLTLLLIFLFMWLTQTFGRIWCGWLCPQTIVSDFTAFIDKNEGKGLKSGRAEEPKSGEKKKTGMKKKGTGKKIANSAVLVPVSGLLAAASIWYFVSPYDFLQRLGQGSLTGVETGFWITLTIIIFLNFAFLRRRFCASICPYGMMQSLLFDEHTLIIGLDPEREQECIKCLNCVKTCPTHIDIRDGQNNACIACARCVDACAGVMHKLKKKTLIDYMFGYDKKKKWLRPATIISSLATLFFLGLFVLTLMGMKPFQLEVFPSQSFYPRMNNSGDRMVNGYQVKIKNHRNKAVTVELSVQGLDNHPYSIEPGTRFSVKGRDTLTTDIFLLIPAHLMEKKPLLSLSMKSVSLENNEISSEYDISFRRPFKRIRKKKEDKKIRR